MGEKKTLLYVQIETGNTLLFSAGTARVANVEHRAVIFKSGIEFQKAINQTTKL